MSSRIRKGCQFNQVNEEEGRYVNPDDIYLPAGYGIEVFAMGLNAPISMLFTRAGDLYVAESGYISDLPRVLRLTEDGFEVVADEFNTPITGINYLDGNLYVSHKGAITAVHVDGTREDIITGLPSNGDFSNNNVTFGSDGKMYFGQGTATNSAVVGLDNGWLYHHPFIFDYPGTFIMMNGQNFETENILVAADEHTFTGAYSPFGIPNQAFEVKKGVIRANGSILRSNLDGSELELYAWGFRNPVRIRFDQDFRLFAANHGYEIRGSRPIANAPDEFHLVREGTWYGWPDYAGGEPVTNPRFAPEGGKQPEFLMTNHPNYPPRPYAAFPPQSNIMGFDFNYNPGFANYGDVFIAEFGPASPSSVVNSTPYTGIGHRISQINMSTGGVTTFAINKTGFPAHLTQEGGINRPVDVVFGPDNAMYVLDLGMNVRNNPNEYLANTGVIWKIVRVKNNNRH